MPCVAPCAAALLTTLEAAAILVGSVTGLLASLAGRSAPRELANHIAVRATIGKINHFLCDAAFLVFNVFPVPKVLPDFGLGSNKTVNVI
jgi:hypothetical protein